MNVDTRDDALGRVLDNAVRHLEPSTDRLPQIRRRGSRRRFVILASAVAGVTLFVAAVIGTAALTRADRSHEPASGGIVPSSRPADVHTQPALITHQDDEHRFTLTYPENWFLAQEALTPNLVDPFEILSLGTHELRRGGDECWQYPVNALEDMGPADVLLTIQEEHMSPSELESFPQRPEHFSQDLGAPSEAQFCVRGPAGFIDRWIRFQDQGRGFYVLVAIGTQASEETRQQAWEILDSLQFEPVE